jgi:MFS family permease
MKTRRPRVFYGWWIVSAAFFIQLYCAGVLNFGFTAIFGPMVQEFGWSYAQISFAASLRGLEAGILAPLIGFLVDRWGPRRLLTFGILIVGLGLVLLSQVNSLAMFYTSFILIALGIASCSGVLFMTVIVKWFYKNVGVAIGIASSGFALGGLLVPLVTFLIDVFGWRSAMTYLGVGLWAICLPLSLLVRNRRPEDGPIDEQVKHGNPAIESSPCPQPLVADSPARQALKSREFWHVTISLLLLSCVMNSVIIHVMPFLATVGVERTVSSFIAMAIPVTSIVGRLWFGWMGDRHSKLWLTAFGFLLTCVGLGFFGSLSSSSLGLLFPFVIFFGLGWGVSVPMRVALLREYFGRTRFGTIHGFTVGIMTIGNIVGPPVAGWVFDTSGSYRSIWYIYAGLMVLAIGIIATAPRPQKIPRLAKAPPV